MSTGYQIYNQYGVHYVTFQIVQWADIFTREVYRTIVTDSLKHCIKAKGLNVHGWVIMSNHIHCIISAKEGNLSDIVRDFKTFTSKAIWQQLQKGPESRREWLQMIFHFTAANNSRNKEIQVWTQENHAIELHSMHFLQQKLNYIHQNPVRAGIVTEAHHYTYSSAIDYVNGTQSGILPITFLQS